MSENPTSPPPGWYRDTSGETRWWDGNTWTEHVQVPSAPVASVAPPVEAPTPMESRKLDEAVAAAVAYGCRIESRTPTQVVLVYGKQPNHVLHFILSILTVGLWLFVWLLNSIGRHESRVILTLDENGEVQQRNLD